jgi:DNA-binding PadR family transcriptional regulator
VKIAENKTGKTDLYTGKKAVLHELSQGTFSNILRTMTVLDLVQELAGPGNNRKEKYYAITSSGDLAVQLALIKPRKP